MLFYQYIFEWGLKCLISFLISVTQCHAQNRQQNNNCWMSELKWHKMNAVNDSDSLQENVSCLQQWTRIKELEFNKNKYTFQLHKLSSEETDRKIYWFLLPGHSVWACVVLRLPLKAIESIVPSVLSNHTWRTEFCYSTVFLKGHWQSRMHLVESDQHGLNVILSLFNISHPCTCLLQLCFQRQEIWFLLSLK